MKRRLTDKFVDALTAGNRPIRIFFFGGVLLAYLFMTVLGKIFGLNTNLGGDINLPNIILMTISILIGFGVSYSAMDFLDNIKQQRTEDKR